MESSVGDQISKTSENWPKLKRLECAAVRAVLDKAINQIAVLKHLLPPPETDGREDHEPISDRLTKVHRLKPPENVESEQTLRLKQVQRWRTFAQYVLEETAQELGLKRTCNVLKNILFIQNLQYYDTFSLKQENINLNNQIRDLNDKVKEVKKNSQLSLIYLSKMSESCLEQATVTAWAQAETISRNSETGLQAQKDLNKYRLKAKEDEFSNCIDKYMSDIEKENIVHSEITNHLNFMIETLQKKLERWTNRYSEEVDNLDIALLQLRGKVEEQQEKIATLSQQYSAKKEDADLLQLEADERDREAELRVRQSKAAIIIQQWWRKILFRKMLLQKRKRKSKSTEKKKKKKKK